MKRNYCLSLVLLALLGMSVPYSVVAADNALSSQSTQQAKTITGKVVDVAGEPIIGASVLVKGSSTGSVTDIDGKFSVEAPVGSTLVVSFVGYATEEVKVGTASDYTVTLKDDTQSLSEVVVTAMGIKKEKKALGYSVSDINSKELMKNKQTNVVNSLAGKIPGVNITQAGGAAGAGSNIVIRGGNSASESRDNQPLFVVDGIIYDNSTVNTGNSGTDGMTKTATTFSNRVMDINPEDIESMTVLKDAAAASLYGSRAANGVIIITTKQGKEGKIRVDLNAGLTTSWYSSKMDMLNTNEYGQALWQANINSGKDPNTNSIGYTFDWGYDDKGNARLNKIILPEFIDSERTMRTSDTDWFDAVASTGIMQNYDLSVSNGTEKGNYFFSLGYLKNDGIIKNSEFDRLSARVNTSYKLFNDIVTIGENFTFNNTHEVEAPGGVLDAALQALPIIPIYTENGKWGGPIGSMNDRQNPVRLVDAVKDNRYSYWRTFGNAYVSVKPLKGLELRTNFGLDYGNFFRRDLNKKYESGKLKNDVNSVKLNQGHWLKWNWNATATYQFEIGKHRMDVLAGVGVF